MSKVSEERRTLNKLGYEFGLITSKVSNINALFGAIESEVENQCLNEYFPYTLLPIIQEQFEELFEYLTTCEGWLKESKEVSVDD